MEENQILDEETTEEEAPCEVVDFEAMYLEMLDKYQRTLAEFDNFRKRTAKEMLSRYDEGVRNAAARFLPSLDNLERAVNANESKEDGFYQGVSLILKGLLETFTALDIKPIEAEPGCPFNANLHNAVAHTEDENFGENQIAEVLQKGYMYKDKILRHSMVRVAN